MVKVMLHQGPFRRIVLVLFLLLLCSFVYRPLSCGVEAHAGAVRKHTDDGGGGGDGLSIAKTTRMAAQDAKWRRCRSECTTTTTNHTAAQTLAFSCYQFHIFDVISMLRQDKDDEDDNNR